MIKKLWLDKIQEILPKKRLGVVAVWSVVAVVFVVCTGWAYYAHTTANSRNLSDKATDSHKASQLAASSEVLATGTTANTDGAKQPSPAVAATDSPSPSVKPNNQKTSSQSPTPRPTSGGDYGQVTPNPYCPEPNFSLSATAGANALYLDAIPAPGDPSTKPECGGGINFTPKLQHPSNNYFCDGLLIPYPTGHTWGFSCTMYGTVPYGVYTFTFTVTGINGYGKSSTRTTTYTYNYQQQ